MLKDVYAKNISYIHRIKLKSHDKIFEIGIYRMGYVIISL